MKYEQEASGEIVWIPEGTTFTNDDLLFYRDKGIRRIEEVAGDIDLIITGPHATAALPRELEGWIEPGITERVQHDFSDCTTSDLGKAWAQADPHVLYIENPHPRVMGDPNRPYPTDIEGDLREFYVRIRRRSTGESVSFGGIDALRPITFGGAPFLREPSNDTEWVELIAILTGVGERGSLAYRTIRDETIEQVFHAKAQTLSQIDLGSVTNAELNVARHLTVQCLHDTMNATISSDGSVNVDKPAAERLPAIASLGNRGDARGEPRSPDGGALLTPRDVITMSGAAMRSTQRALSLAFDVPADEVEMSLALNSPYLGAFEVQEIARDLHVLETRAVVRHTSGHGLIRMNADAYQAEFLREALLGPVNTDHVRRAGTDWPQADAAHIRDLVGKLRDAYDILRRWNYQLEPMTRYRPPTFR